jgi:protein-S-isoprenylcysteine O-methyltransferase Ste14
VNLSDSTHVLSSPAVPPAVTRRRWISVLDSAERLIIVLFYVQMVVRLVRDAYLLGNPLALLLLPSEGLVIALIVLRKPAQDLTTRWTDWLAAMAATALPTLVVATPRASSQALTLAAAAAAVTGLIVQVHAKVSLGRTIGMVAANRGIRVGGPYQWVRHPMYLGYLISHVAFVTVNWCGWNVCLLSMVTLLQVYRIAAEEKLLRNDPEYRRYEERVPYRFWPGLF